MSKREIHNRSLFYAGNFTALIIITFTPGRGDPLATSTLSTSCFIQNLNTVRLRMPCSPEKKFDSEVFYNESQS